MIAVLAQKLILNRWEKYVHHFVLNIELAKERRIQAANVIKYAVKLWLLKRKRGSLSSIKSLQINRKLFQSINIFDQIKQEQRGLIDICIGLPEIVTLERHTSTNTDDIITKMTNLELKMENMKEQLINVNQTIDNIRNTLNLLVDNITK